MYVAQTPSNCPDFRGQDIDWSSHNQGITPEFFANTVKRADGTEFEQEFVNICIAGDILTVCSLPMDAQLKERFADQYEAWRSGKELALPGTPLAKWPPLNSRQVSALEAINVFTVENLAHVADGNIHNVTDGRALRDKAIAWLKLKDKTALEDENARLWAEIDALKKGQATPPMKGKLKLAPWSQPRRDAQSRAKIAWHAKRRAALEELASVTDSSAKSEAKPESLAVSLKE